MLENKENLKNKLSKKYSLNAFGAWQIFRESREVDRFSKEPDPILEIVTGTYGNVVLYAINLKEFFDGTGCGGSINKFEPRNIDSYFPEINNLFIEKDNLHDQLNNLKIVNCYGREEEESILYKIRKINKKLFDDYGIDLR